MGLMMEMNNSDFERYLRAQKQVEEIRKFYSNVIAFVVVNLFLMFINLRYSPQYLWFLWSVGSWGVGLFFHGLKTFNYKPFLGKDWEERKIKELMDKEKQNRYE